MQKKKLYWSLQAVGWSGYALMLILLRALSDESVLPLMPKLILTSFFFFVSTHWFRKLLIHFELLAASLPGFLPLAVAGAFGLGVLNYLFDIITSYLYGMLSATDLQFGYIFLHILSTGIIYFLWILMYFGYHYFLRYQASLKYQTEIKEMELNRLKSQLNPHFIFNALNSIRALVDESPRDAKESITQLSSILRSTLVMSKNKLIAFEDELQTVKDYLALEGIRFEERLRVNFDIDPRSFWCQVPPLMVQTLVENAIKHGISNLPCGGGLLLKTFFDGLDRMHIQIVNSGQLKEKGGEEKREGRGQYGIENTKRRLKLIYGDKASFSIQNISELQVMVELVIPKEEQLANV